MRWLWHKMNLGKLPSRKRVRVFLMVKEDLSVPLLSRTASWWLQDIIAYLPIRTPPAMARWMPFAGHVRGSALLTSRDVNSIPLANHVTCACVHVCGPISAGYYGCTIADNEMIGFRDNKFDQIFGGRDKLGDYMQEIDREACLRLFEEYVGMDATKY